MNFFKGMKVFITEDSIDVASFDDNDTISCKKMCDKRKKNSFNDNDIISSDIKISKNKNKKSSKKITLKTRKSMYKPLDNFRTNNNIDIKFIDKNNQKKPMEILKNKIKNTINNANGSILPQNIMVNEYTNNDEINEDTLITKTYIEKMDKIVDKIKKMKWGDTIRVESDPYYIPSCGKRYCTIKKLIRFSTFLFSGYGSKTILRFFIEKTKSDPEHGYEKIIQLLDNRSFRRFLPIKSWEFFWENYSDEQIKNRHIFELIRSDQPCKPYLDIEWYVDSLEDARKMDHSIFVNKIQCDLITIFKNRYNVEIYNNDILIASSHSEDKASFHIVIDKTIDGNTVGFKTNRKGYPESAWDLWVALIEHDLSYENVLDGSVYSNDREFRAIFSNKTSEFRPFIPYSSNTIDKNDIIKLNTSMCLRYIITYSPNNTYKYIDTPEIGAKYSVINKKYCVDGSMSHRYTNNKINYLINLIKSMHRTVEYTGRSSCGTGWRFSYTNKNEPCYTGNIHESNGFYVFEDSNRGIYMKCMSENCKGIHVLERSEHPIYYKKLFR